jgi:hypothetical protein
MMATWAWTRTFPSFGLMKSRLGEWHAIAVKVCALNFLQTSAHEKRHLDLANGVSRGREDFSRPTDIPKISGRFMVSLVQNFDVLDAVHFFGFVVIKFS